VVDDQVRRQVGVGQVAVVARELVARRQGLVDQRARRERGQIHIAERPLDVGLGAEHGAGELVAEDQALAHDALPDLAPGLVRGAAHGAVVHGHRAPAQGQDAVAAQGGVDLVLPERDVAALAHGEEHHTHTQAVPRGQAAARRDEPLEERARRGHDQAGAVPRVVQRAAAVLHAAQALERLADQVVRGAAQVGDGPHAAAAPAGVRAEAVDEGIQGALRVGSAGHGADQATV
jgi:hypothetical protein